MTFPIVAIAASAGGLEPLLELLGAVPSRSGVAYIVIQHLDPNHESLLSEILGRKTTMPVEQAVDGQLVEPDHVYVIPPNASLTLAEGRLQVNPRGAGRDRHLPADVLFRSLASVHGENSISVVLSGGDSDGALGTQAIKHAGGITFAQDPASARFPGMPSHAIETGCVDFVLRPAEIARELARLPQQPYLKPPQPISRQRAIQSDADEADDETSLQRVFRRLKSAHGVDFSRYKRSTLRRRLARRMALQHVDQLADYAALIERDPEEVAALYQDFLIRVTEFFRDSQSFEALAQRVFPVICESRSPKESIRIWVPGCATGEEVYSIAIALTEYLGERPAAAGVQLFGSDVSETAIEKARAGVYLDSITQDVSPDRLQRFFVKQDHHYRIAKSIRDLCIFARQDVTRDPPFSRLDLISCRNLLIYLDAAPQRRVMQIFHYALRPHGFLMLGPSESVGAENDLFELTDKPHRIFVRKPASANGSLDLAGSRPAATPYDRGMESDVIESATKLEADTVHRAAERLLLARYAPSGVLVDDALNVLHFHGDPTPYLAHASGPPSLNLNRIARPQLLIELLPAIQEARDSGTEVHRDNLVVDGLEQVNLEVIPLKRLTAELCYLILFVEVDRDRDRRPSPPPVSPLSETEKDRQVALAARELAAMRAYLQGTLEEQEAVKEELKSAHEEVLSANEEFQSTNEELQTSKEELQSANEELVTTNEELRNRNHELALVNAELEKTRAAAVEAQAYADEIIDTVCDPLVVLDAQLRIVRANQAFYSQLRLTPALAEGLPLYELGDRQWDLPPLREQLAAVLKRAEPLNNVEVPYVVPLLGPRVFCLNARRIAPHNERVELILLVLEDMTERRANADTLREGSRRKDEFLAMLAHELRNPLAPLMHTITLLRRAEVDAQTLKRYELMERQIHRMVRLVDELLDVARISRGLIELKREPLDLRSTVRQSVEASRARTEQFQHALSLSLPDAPSYVEGDPVRLEQVVSNLIENACKYTPAGGKITVILAEENGEAVLSVRDTGIGLAPDMLDRIFDLFTQVDSTLARAGGGLGLGLTVVQRVLELHGGRIVARSAGLGQGSEFIVRLPLAPVSERLMRGNRKDTEPASSPVPRRVLIVDDNVDSADSMAALVSAWGHETAVARDGEDALGLAARFVPDTALVDIGLPGMDGYELARRVRKVPGLEAMRLVAMTGYGRAEDRSAARAAGFDVHLVKPAELAELERLLASPQPGFNQR